MKRNIFIGIVASILIICLISCSILASDHDRDTVRTYVSATVRGEEIRIPVEINTIDKAAENSSHIIKLEKVHTAWQDGIDTIIDSKIDGFIKNLQTEK